MESPARQDQASALTHLSEPTRNGANAYPGHRILPLSALKAVCLVEAPLCLLGVPPRDPAIYGSLLFATAELAACRHELC